MSTRRSPLGSISTVLVCLDQTVLARAELFRCVLLPTSVVKFSTLRRAPMRLDRVIAKCRCVFTLPRPVTVRHWPSPDYGPWYSEMVIPINRSPRCSTPPDSQVRRTVFSAASLFQARPRRQARTEPALDHCRATQHSADRRGTRGKHLRHGHRKIIDQCGKLNVAHRQSRS